MVTRKQRRKKTEDRVATLQVGDQLQRPPPKVVDGQGLNPITRGTMSSTRFRKDKEIIAEYETQVKGAV